MVFEKGQIFTVRDVNSINDSIFDLEGNCYFKPELTQAGIADAVAFNYTMQKAKTATVKHVINSISFIGTDGWYWHSWMLDIPQKKLTLMTTE